jgi:hypothetical protein
LPQAQRRPPFVVSLILQAYINNFASNEHFGFITSSQEPVRVHGGGTLSLTPRFSELIAGT